MAAAYQQNLRAQEHAACPQAEGRGTRFGHWVGAQGFQAAHPKLQLGSEAPRAHKTYDYQNAKPTPTTVRGLHS